MSTQGGFIFLENHLHFLDLVAEVLMFWSGEGLVVAFTLQDNLTAGAATKIGLPVHTAHPVMSPSKIMNWRSWL